jgi:hypothetical protein
MSNIVCLLMTFVILVTAPLIVIPCREMIKGRLGAGMTDDNRQPQSSMLTQRRIVVRIPFCLTCIVLLKLVPNGLYTCSGSTMGLLCFVYNSQEELAQMGCFSVRQGASKRTLDSQWLIDHSAWIIVKVGMQRPLDNFLVVDC